MMNEKIVEVESQGPWPENLIGDVHIARNELVASYEEVRPHWEHFGVGLLASSGLWGALEYPMENGTLYRSFLLKNNLVVAIGSTNFLNEVGHKDAVIFFGRGKCIIKNIEVQLTKKCSYCDNTFPLHAHGEKLRDGRLICDVCYAKVFDSVLLRDLQETKTEVND